jgi:hypothetical protein
MSSLKKSLKRALGKEKKYSSIDLFEYLSPEEIIHLPPKKVSSEVFDESFIGLKKEQKFALRQLEEIKKLMKKNHDETIYNRAVEKALTKLKEHRIQERKDDEAAEQIFQSVKKQVDAEKAKTAKLDAEISDLNRRLKALNTSGGKRKTQKRQNKSKKSRRNRKKTNKK